MKDMTSICDVVIIKCTTLQIPFIKNISIKLRIATENCATNIISLCVFGSFSLFLMLFLYFISQFIFLLRIKKKKPIFALNNFGNSYF